MTPARETLSRFWREEAERVGRPYELSHVGGLNHATRLLGFLSRTLTEVEEATVAFLANVERREAYEATHDGGVDPQLFEEGGRLSVIVHLRVETFHALARLLLDRLADAPTRYFGAAADLPLSSHRELQANLAAFAEQKGQVVPPGLEAKIELMTATFFVDRDLHVSLPGERPYTASVWSSSGDAGMTPGDACAGESVALCELLEQLEQYVEDIVAYLDANRRI
jgi:hypothetical protein